jgi:hypothetical protein
MDKIEAFRVHVRRLTGRTTFENTVDRNIGLRSAIKNILHPLRLGKRLSFSFLVDEQKPPHEWLVVSLESSGQLDLFTDWVAEFERDFELEREAGAAVDLTRNALLTLRRLAAVAELTPTRFHEIIRRQDPVDAPGLLLGIAPHLPEQIVLRDAAGKDVVADGLRLPERATLPEPIEISFTVGFVGLYSAYIHLQRQNGRFYVRKDLLYWGRGTNYRQYYRFYSKALYKRNALSCSVRETLNPKGKTMRFELVEEDLEGTKI